VDVNSWLTGGLVGRQKHSRLGLDPKIHLSGKRVNQDLGYLLEAAFRDFSTDMISVTENWNGATSGP
jgi:hypothetical protein